MKITFACGHERDITLTGTRTDRTRKADYLSSQICYGCQKEEAEKQHAVENRKFQQRATKAGMPTMTGTEKQVAWAVTIRGLVLEEATSVLASPECGLAQKELLEKVVRYLLTHTDASWWIKAKEYRPPNDIQSRAESLLSIFEPRYSRAREVKLKHFVDYYYHRLEEDAKTEQKVLAQQADNEALRQIATASHAAGMSLHTAKAWAGDNDRRVYLDGEGQDSITYYREGSKYVAADTLSCSREINDEQQEIIRAACKSLLLRWKTNRWPLPVIAPVAPTLTSGR